MSPRLWLFDARRMGMDVRVQCERRIEDLGLELGASRLRLAESAGGAPYQTPLSPPGSPAQLLPWVMAWKVESEASGISALTATPSHQRGMGGFAAGSSGGSSYLPASTRTLRAAPQPSYADFSSPHPVMGQQCRKLPVS